MKKMGNKFNNNHARQMTMMLGTIHQGRMKAEEHFKHISHDFVLSSTNEAVSVCILVDSTPWIHYNEFSTCVCSKMLKLVIWYSDYGRNCDGTHGGSHISRQSATWLTSFSLFLKAYEQAHTLKLEQPRLA